ncbi:MAG: ATP-binding protein [Actinomycetota bacterium]|nr:ATP-binding protein [Rubrobacteraceae bacterium]MBA3614578.1 ATP-binding protein [Rubrobacteraceae bacterium]MDQ3182745.1 ATP-binding protein [Actinomycetota bacterium]
MTDMKATPEEPIACVTVSADAGFLPPVVEFVKQMTRQLGLRDAEHVDQAVELVCMNVVEHAFGPEEEGTLDVQVLRRAGLVVVAVEDQGLPFDYKRLEDGEDRTVLEVLHGSFDETRFVNLGRRGNRVELLKHLPNTDVRDHLPEDEHRRALEATAVPEVIPLEIRMMRPEESFELSRCVYRSYGYSYDWDYIYYPDRIRELQEKGLMISCVAVTPEGEFVGHLAITLDHPDSPVGEAGQAVVDPRFRGHHLFPRMKTFMAEWAGEAGMYGLYSEATAVHPYSQRGNLHLGARETGFLLGYIPASVSYKQIGEEREGRRGSVALFYMRVKDEPEREIYPPAPYLEAIRRVVEHNGLRRVIDEVHDPALQPSRMSVEVRQDHNLAFMRVDEPGADLEELVHGHLRDLCLHHVDCVYVDLPLSHPATPGAAAGLKNLGVFFGGIIPEAHPGGGDVLRLQYLNNIEIQAGDVSTASDFGEELLGLIFRQNTLP